jgi:hypothetical protein
VLLRGKCSENGLFFYGDTLWKINLEATEDFLVSSEKVPKEYRRPSQQFFKGSRDLFGKKMPETCWDGGTVLVFKNVHWLSED